MWVNPRATPVSVKVLGAGCARCRKLATHARAALDALGIGAPVEVVDDPLVIADHRVMSLPALVIDGRMILSGSVPRVKELCALIDRAVTPQAPDIGTSGSR